MTFSALLDTCVLAPSVLRDLFSQYPGDFLFLMDLQGLDQDRIIDAIDTICARSGRRGPRWTRADIIGQLEREKLPTFVATAKAALK